MAIHRFVELLLGYDVLLEIKNNAEQTALSIAQENGYDDIVALLSEQGKRQ